MKVKRRESSNSANDTAAERQLDDLDLALIELLQQDGRMPMTELGVKLGVSHATVRNRLDRLSAAQVIRMTAVVDPAMVGFDTQVLIGVQASLRHVVTMEKQLMQFNEIYFVATATGRYDLIIGGVFRSDGDLREFLLQKMSKVQGIRALETFHVLNMGKRLWQWHIPSKVT